MAAFYRLAERAAVPVPIDLPPVKRDIDADPERVGGEDVGLDGTLGRDTIGWRQTWALSFGRITDDVYESQVRAWTRRGVHGLGPHLLYEGDADPVLVHVVAVPRRRVTRGWSVAGMTLVAAEVTP